MIAIIRKLAVLMMVFGGCSFGMRGVDPEWDRKQEPVCTDSYVPVFVDGFVSTIIASTTAQVAADSEVPLDASVVVGAIGISLLYTVGALVGVSKYNECRLAKAEWYASEAIRESSAKADVAPSSPAARSPAAPSSPAALDSPSALGSPAARSARLVSTTVPPGVLLHELTLASRVESMHAWARRVRTCSRGPRRTGQ
jgi:hypothetical protein